jgi:hypothetical protein
MGVRSSVELTVQLGQDNQLVDKLFERDLTEVLDSLDHATVVSATLASGETNFVVPFGDVTEARLIYIEADGEFAVTLGGGLATAGSVDASGGTYPTGFVGGETLVLDIDNGTAVSVTFTASASLLPAVINEINAAAALVGLAPIASDTGATELRLTSTTTGVTSEVEVVSGTALATLGLTAGTSNGVNATAGTSPLVIRRPVDITGADLGAGVAAFFLATVVTTSLTIDNLLVGTLRLRVAIAGDIVATPVGC